MVWRSESHGRKQRLKDVETWCSRLDYHLNRAIPVSLASVANFSGGRDPEDLTKGKGHFAPSCARGFTHRGRKLLQRKPRLIATEFSFPMHVSLEVLQSRRLVPYLFTRKAE